MSQKQLRKPDKAKEASVEEITTDTTKRTALTAEMDALLDEIDEVLETNAETFVKDFQQKGGQ